MANIRFFGLMLIIAIFFGCSRTNDEIAQPGVAQNEYRAVVITEPVRVGTFVLYGEYIGESQGIMEITLKTEFDGRVNKVFVTEGDYVRAGQSLAEIELEKIRKNYEAHVLKQKIARETYERELKFLDDGNTYQLKVDQAHLTWLQSQSDLLTAQKMLDSALVKSPFNGIVVRRHIDPYDNLENGDPTIEIANLDSIRVTVNVPEADISGVRNLKEAEIIFTAHPDRVFYGTPTRFTRVRSETSLSYEVTVEADNPEGLILSGQTARVRLTLKEYPNTISVPSRAVMIRNDGNYVFAVRNGIAHELQVVTGVNSDTRTVIKDGLSPDDMIVAEGFNRLADGEIVEIKN